MPRIIVALNRPDRIADFIVFANFVAQCFAADARFASPPIPLSVFKAHIAELEAGEQHTYTRALGSVGDRDAKRLTVHNDLAQLGAFVQQLADTDLENALAIIEASGFDVKGSSGHGKSDFEAKQGPVSGSAHVVARAEKTRSASYDWEHGTKPAALQRAESTVKADTVTSDWGDVVSLLVR